MAGDPTAAATAGPKPPLTLLNRLIVFDTALSLLIHDVCRPIPRFLLKTLEISGDGRLWFPIPISLLPFSSPLYFSLLLSLLLGSLLDLLLVGLIKSLVRRPRPVYNKGMTLVVAVDHWSFPSGHSSRVFFIACFLCLSSLASVGFGDRAEVVVRGVFVWAAATSISRVLLGRHFVLDVVAGASLGVMEALVVYRFFNSTEFVVGRPMSGNTTLLAIHGCQLIQSCSHWKKKTSSSATTPTFDLLIAEPFSTHQSAAATFLLIFSGLAYQMTAHKLVSRKEVFIHIDQVLNGFSWFHCFPCQEQGKVWAQDYYSLANNLDSRKK